jgi:predicted AAA+ superfamily ATPase
MEELISYSEQRLAKTDLSFSRYIANEIDWKDNLFSIEGARGSGKTTFLLQHLKKNHLPENRLYISLDHMYFQSNNLYTVLKWAATNNIKSIVVDEVHKYPNWSIEIKNIHDLYDDLQIIFTGSALLEIQKAKADLSRRAVNYRLDTMSFREFLEFDKNIKVDTYTLADIIKSHSEIAQEIKKQTEAPLVHFQRYLKFGAYPYYKINENNYHHRLMNTFNLVLETDVPAIENITYTSVLKMKRLLAFIAQSVPFKPNITKLAELTASKRDTVLQHLLILERARILNLLRPADATPTHLKKPEKIFLENPNIAHALTFDKAPDIGNLRESFFYSQLSHKHQVNASQVHDFLIDKKYDFEIGGRGKSMQKLNKKNECYALDNLEFGTGNRIPLFLFGLMY